MSRAGGIVGEYLALKAESDADLLAMQVGDFYEFFADDARTVARELGLKVSEKSSHGSTYPMAGVPVAELPTYLRQLVERGYRVAVADQHDAGGEIDRTVTRVATPGTLVETQAAEARYLGAVARTDTGYGVAFAEVTTGEFLATAVPDEDGALAECARFEPVELLVGPRVREDENLLEGLVECTGTKPTMPDANAFAPEASAHAVREQFGRGSIDSIGLADASVRAAGAILAYVEETGVGVATSMTRLRSYRADEYVELDATTQRNLELVETMVHGGDGSLIGVLDHTVTAPGRRLLRAWLLRPQRDVDEIERRQAAVAALCASALGREAVRETLAEAYDLERLASQAASGRAGAPELRRVRRTLGLLPDLEDHVSSTPALAESPLAAVLASIPDDRVARLHDRLAEALRDDPDDWYISTGYHDELDEIAARYDETRSWIDGLAEREQRRHAITHLQVGRNRTDGYYLQVGRSETEKVPDAYEEIKTLKSSKRYTTEALREREREIIRLEERREELERELLAELRETVAAEAELLQNAGRALAEFDTVASLAGHAADLGWTRPTFVGQPDGAGGIAIDGGRHPVVEQTVEFVPNDVALSADRRLLLVTGPNMSGKSTYLRGTALIVLLAQIGSFVPADRAEIAPVDGIFTRVGALDELAEGRSTFMVEMQELSNILHSAGEQSLVVLDEVGRGTATYDGISLAWAATEYLHNEVGAMTLFATHYHELTALADRLPRVANVHVAVAEDDGEVTFLRTVQEGATDRSYGIHVAELAGVPAPVLERASDVLERLREQNAIEAIGGGEPSQVQAVFDLGAGRFRGSATADGGGEQPLAPSVESVLEELRGVDVDATAPLELMARIQEWQDRLRQE